jgi:sugar phosphate isomerase/epimerase
MFAASGVLPGQWSLPVAWNKDEQWQADLAALPQLASLGRQLGCTRTTTWIMPGSDAYAYTANWEWHIRRFRPIASALADEGCSLGIEFVGPRTLRARFAHPFVFTLGGMMDLAAAIGTGNVGLLLDAFHLFVSGGSVADMARLTAADVVAVHVNDGVEGVPLDEQLDQVRRLPTESGVLPLADFMRGLQKIGYDGPVTAEPFSARVNALTDPHQAAALVAEYMDRLWRASGLS